MLETVRRSNSEAIECRVRAAIKKLLDTGVTISFYSVAKEACVARSTLYRRPELKILVEEARQKNSHQVPASAVAGNADSSEVALLRQSLADAEAEITRLLAIEANRRESGSPLVYSVCAI